MNNLYTDGGVITINPSKIGGTWAYVLVENGIAHPPVAGVITPAEARMETVSNNLTEMLAMLKGLSSLPSDWCGTVCSDSQITLGRVFQSWKWKNIPEWMLDIYHAEKKRLVNFDFFQWTLLEGHPTKKMLERGRGIKYPVSEYNVLCDELCKLQAQMFLQEVTA